MYHSSIQQQPSLHSSVDRLCAVIAKAKPSTKHNANWDHAPGVPIKSSNSIDGWDSVLSILQMPSGVPVATVALNASKNAGILATQIIGTFDNGVAEKMIEYKNQLKDDVQKKVTAMKSTWPNGFDE